MNITLKLIDLLGRTQINKWYKFIKKSQFWSEAEQIDYQTKQLKLIVEHAYQNVPYYRQLFKKLNLTPKDIQSKDDLVKIPIITRKILQDNYQELIADNHKQFKSQNRSTGGTTGEPVRYLSDINSWSLHWALKYRAWEWGGYKIGDNVGVMGGASVIPSKVTRSRKVWNRLNRLYPMPTGHMTNEIYKGFISKIRFEEIKCLRGYPSSIAEFARYCKEMKIDLDVQSIITTAEVLQPAYKEEIKKTFRAVIIDSYGCADGGGNANTCASDCGFHVSFESAIWEVCTPEGIPVKKNDPGEVTLTSLTNYAMPLLRYQPGDVIENTFDYNKCSCGSSLPRIKSILGRTIDILHFQNGRSLGGPAFTLFFRHFPLVKWQMVQNDMESLDVNIIPASDFNAVHEQEISKLMHYHCGEGVSIRINKVDEIKIPQSGKQRIIINNTL
jgi:phenylacetate-CoA ligase